MTKFCPRCQRELDQSEFNWKVKGRWLAVYCKECSRAYIREHYHNNTAYYIRKAKKRNIIVKQETVQYLAKYLLSHPCIDCGEKDICVLEFDHIDRTEKLLEVATMVKRKWSIQSLKNEVKKCVVRCANCHRRKTMREQHSWKIQYAPVV